MADPSKKTDLSVWHNLRHDFPAGIVVFLVALPLCLGIALASQGQQVSAPLFSGLLAGILGGLVIPLISRSPLSVSGPAAGLIAIVISGMDQAGSFEAFLVAVFLGGLLQVGLGLLKAGTIAYFFPNSVIKGMLAAIGLILIRKQIVHAVGLDVEAIDENFHFFDTLSVFKEILIEGHFEVGAIIISLVSLAILILWDQTRLHKINFLPGALVVVVVGVLLNLGFQYIAPSLQLLGDTFRPDGSIKEMGHLVALPQSMVNDGVRGFVSEFKFPDWRALANTEIYVIALTIGLVASVETLLSVEAVDKLDPHKRNSPLNRELLAQGVANTFAGLLGALPITAVIVRSSANVNAGGQTRMAAFLHGVFLFVSVITIAQVLNLIPLACLAAILLMIGYKLARPALWRQMYAGGMNQFLPFAITILAVLVTDLLKGIAIGTAVGIFFTIRANFHTAIQVSEEEDGSFLLSLYKDVSFLNKPILYKALDRIPAGSTVLVDASRTDFIDTDIQEALKEFEVRAEENDITINIVGLEAAKMKVPEQVM